jgi:hypothetical protein
MLLQRFTMSRMSVLANVVRGTIEMLRFSEVVIVPRTLLHHVGLGK